MRDIGFFGQGQKMPLTIYAVFSTLAELQAALPSIPFQSLVEIYDPSLDNKQGSWSPYQGNLYLVMYDAKQGGKALRQVGKLTTLAEKINFEQITTTTLQDLRIKSESEYSNYLRNFRLETMDPLSGQISLVTDFDLYSVVKQATFPAGKKDYAALKKLFTEKESEFILKRVLPLYPYTTDKNVSELPEDEWGKDKKILLPVDKNSKTYHIFGGKEKISQMIGGEAFQRSVQYIFMINSLDNSILQIPTMEGQVGPQGKQGEQGIQGDSITTTIKHYSYNELLAAVQDGSYKGDYPIEELFDESTWTFFQALPGDQFVESQIVAPEDLDLIPGSITESMKKDWIKIAKEVLTQHTNRVFLSHIDFQIKKTDNPTLENSDHTDILNSAAVGVSLSPIEKRYKDETGKFDEFRMAIPTLQINYQDKSIYVSYVAGGLNGASPALGDTKVVTLQNWIDERWDGKDVNLFNRLEQLSFKEGGGMEKIPSSSSQYMTLTEFQNLLVSIKKIPYKKDYTLIDAGDNSITLGDKNLEVPFMSLYPYTLPRVARPDEQGVITVIKPARMVTLNFETLEAFISPVYGEQGPIGPKGPRGDNGGIFIKERLEIKLSDLDLSKPNADIEIQIKNIISNILKEVKERWVRLPAIYGDGSGLVIEIPEYKSNIASEPKVVSTAQLYSWFDSNFFETYVRLDSIRGIDGKKGDTGDVGPEGPKGEPWRRSDFTADDWKSFKGDQGNPGKDGRNFVIYPNINNSTLAELNDFFGKLIESGTGYQNWLHGAILTKDSYFFWLDNYTTPNKVIMRSASLKGEKGADGAKGSDGPRGYRGKSISSVKFQPTVTPEELNAVDQKAGYYIEKKSEFGSTKYTAHFILNIEIDTPMTNN